MLFGLAYPGKRTQTEPDQASGKQAAIPSAESSVWKDWRNFVVIRKVKESEEITSFYLQPEDRGSLPGFQPGQFLTIRLNIPGQPKPVIRTYSLSDYSENPDYYRLSIKREPMPKELNVPPGIASNFMHDQVQEGSIVEAKPPSGKFVLDVNQPLPAALISNGVGITPMISMAKAVTQLHSGRPLWFIHGARDGSFHAFREEVLALTAENPNLIIHFAYSRPREEDAGYYHSTGYVDAALVQSLVMQEAEYFLCGSPAFMEAIREGLRAANVPESRVFFEMFTAPKKATPEPVSTGTENGKGSSSKVVFQRSNQTVSWTADSDNLLEFAESNGLNPPYSCRQGICGTCECKLLEGEVDYQQPPTATIEPGSVLICIAKPKSSRIVLDL